MHLEKQGTNLDCTGEKVGVRVEPYTRYYCRVTVTGDAGGSGCGTTFFTKRGKGKNRHGLVNLFPTAVRRLSSILFFEKKFSRKSLYWCARGQ